MKKIDDEIKHSAISEYIDCVEVDEITGKYNIARVTLYDWLDKANVRKRKGYKYTPEIREKIVNDYFEQKLTVKQIAAKYNINVRQIYHCVDKSERRGQKIRGSTTKRMTYLSRDEIELILLMIMECEANLSTKNRMIALPLEERLLFMADELTYPN